LFEVLTNAMLLKMHLTQQEVVQIEQNSFRRNNRPIMYSNKRVKT